MKYLEETSIDENLNMELYVFPNPTTDYINIIFDNVAAGSIRIELLNSIGQIISVPVENYYDVGIASLTIKDLQLSNGTYFIRLISPKRTEIKSFISVR
jgi:hypothetical protein